MSVADQDNVITNLSDYRDARAFPISDRGLDRPVYQLGMRLEVVAIGPDGGPLSVGYYPNQIVAGLVIQAINGGNR